MVPDGEPDDKSDLCIRRSVLNSSGSNCFTLYGFPNVKSKLLDGPAIHIFFYFANIPTGATRHVLQLHVDLMWVVLCRSSDVFNFQSKHQVGQQRKEKDACFGETLHLFPRSDACCIFRVRSFGQLTRPRHLQHASFMPLLPAPLTVAQPSR